MATHSSTLAWKIPWMEDPGRLQSMGSQRVRHDWATEKKKKKSSKLLHVFDPSHFYSCVFIDNTPTWFFLTDFLFHSTQNFVTSLSTSVVTIWTSWSVCDNCSVSEGVYCSLLLSFFGVQLLYLVVLVSAIYRGATYMCIFRGMAKEDVIHTYNGIVLSYKMNEVTPFVEVRMDLETVMQKEGKSGREKQIASLPFVIFCESDLGCLGLQASAPLAKTEGCPRLAFLPESAEKAGDEPQGEETEAPLKHC